MNGKVIPLFRRVVVTKEGIVYELEPDQAGTRAADVFGAKIAERLGITDGRFTACRTGSGSPPVPRSPHDPR